MPYVVTTSTPCDCPKPGCLMDKIERHAVATLEETRAAITRELHLGEPGHKNHHGAHDAVIAAQNLPDKGGTVGPLPDGTVIDVRHVDWPYLRAKAGRLPVLTHSKQDVLEAFNA